MSLSPERLILRPIQPEDNPHVEQLILSILSEFGCVGPGYASSDPELKIMYQAYQSPDPLHPDRGYWVIMDVDTRQIYGGGGFSPLKGLPPEAATCELQKVYFHPALRGLGFGRKMVEKCMVEAEKFGYKTMYLESAPQMENAVNLYQKFGFRHLSERLGDTGHSNCPVFMSRPLGSSALVSA